MKKKLSALLACIMAVSGLGSMSAYAFKYDTSAYMEDYYSKEVDYSLWDKFIKYDLCITDYDSLTDEQKALCEFIFETEQAANDNIICERARRTLAGDVDLGERISLYNLENEFGIWDKYSINGIYGWQQYIHCVPDIIHFGSESDSEPIINEYWFDDYRSTYVIFNEKTYSNSIRSFDVFDKDGKLLKNIPAAKPEIEYENFIGDEQAMISLGFVEKNNGYYYIKSDGTAVFVWYKYAKKAQVKPIIEEINAERIDEPFVIESEINGHPVTAIERGAFSKAPLTKIIVPDSVEHISFSAFYNCTYLEEISLPKSLKYLGNSAFMNCTSLNNINIDCPNIRLAESTFFGCENLKSMKLNVNEIGENSVPEALETLELGKNIDKIDYKAFSRCKFLTECKLNVGLQTISQGAFIYSNIKSLTIPSTVTLIGAYPRKTGSDFMLSLGTESPRRPLKDEPVCVFDHDCVISGWYDTEAHSYALQNNLAFKALDENIAYGDTNKDGNVDISDAVMLQRYLIKLDDSIGYEADVNKDGRINAFDMVKFKKQLL